MPGESWYFFARNRDTPVCHNCSYGISHERALEFLYFSENDFAVIIKAGEDDLFTAQVIYRHLYQKWFDMMEHGERDAEKIHNPK